MEITWEGDHSLVEEDVKRDFERQVNLLGDPRSVLVVVRREPEAPDPKGHSYELKITRIGYGETVRLRGGHGTKWIDQYVKLARPRGPE